MEGVGLAAHVGRRRRQRARRRKRGRVWAVIRVLFVGLFATSLASSVAFFGLFGYTYARVADELPRLDAYSEIELAQTSVVYDVRGDVVDELYGVQNRYVVGLDEVSPQLREAVIAIEDHRFYEHQGIDFEAIGRAARQNLQSLSVREGGSTITQQLVKNTYIAQEERQVASLERKMAEASLAWQYEKGHGKEEILEQYLNTVYFGANAYGAEAAARAYYDKGAGELDLAESAMLAGVINLPGTYDPFADPENARERRDLVLDRMLEHGYITEEERDAAAGQEDLALSRGSVERASENDYFLDAVRKDLAARYGDTALYEGGLEIHTTLDPDLQAKAVAAVGKVVTPDSGDPSASLVSVEPSTGAVKAMVGGSDFEQLKFNLATQGKRQPGSSFKMFVLAEAIRQGLSPETGYESKDLSIDTGGEEPYEVQNYNYVERGPISVKHATEQSDNTVFVQLALDLGLENVASLANGMGIESTIDTYPPMAIGGLGEGVTPLEMASAYSTLANEGTHMEPYLVERVTREVDGEEVAVEEHGEPEGEAVLSKDQAAAITQTLRGVVERGTAGRYRNLNTEIGRPSAGKTGTSELFVDAWYIGYVPQLATSVWVGYPEERRSMTYVRGFPEVNGENFPLDIWSLYMQEATKEMPVEELNSPSSDLKLKTGVGGRTSGKLDSKATRKMRSESATPPAPLYGEPQQPPKNPKPPPIYGREQQKAAEASSSQLSPSQPVTPQQPAQTPTPAAPAGGSTTPARSPEG